LLATPFVSAVPGAPKNNGKFLTWHYTKTVNFVLDVIVGGDHQYIPSFEDVNRLVISTDAGFLSYEITVGSNTYYQGVDFDCVDVFSTMYFIKPVFDNPAQLYPAESQSSGLRVDTTFDFDAYPGGIEGALHIREIGAAGAEEGGATYTFSLEGTGDLQNVQVNAVYAVAGFDDVTGVLTVVDDGTVIG
jgi:hypothetical protein